MAPGRTASGLPPWQWPFPYGTTDLPEDFPDRLRFLKEASGLSWEELSARLGVGERQVQRWRNGAAPGGGAMLGLVRLADKVPGCLPLLIAEDAQLNAKAT